VHAREISVSSFHDRLLSLDRSNRDLCEATVAMHVRWPLLGDCNALCRQAAGIAMATTTSYTGLRRVNLEHYYHSVIRRRRRVTQPTDQHDIIAQYTVSVLTSRLDETRPRRLSRAFRCRFTTHSLQFTTYTNKKAS